MSVNSIKPITVSLSILSACMLLIGIPLTIVIWNAEETLGIVLSSAIIIPLNAITMIKIRMRDSLSKSQPPMVSDYLNIIDIIVFILGLLICALWFPMVPSIIVGLSDSLTSIYRVALGAFVLFMLCVIEPILIVRMLAIRLNMSNIIALLRISYWLRGIVLEVNKDDFIAILFYLVQALFIGLSLYLVLPLLDDTHLFSQEQLYYLFEYRSDDLCIGPCDLERPTPVELYLPSALVLYSTATLIIGTALAGIIYYLVSISRAYALIRAINHVKLAQKIILTLLTVLAFALIFWHQPVLRTYHFYTDGDVSVYFDYPGWTESLERRIEFAALSLIYLFSIIFSANSVNQLRSLRKQRTDKHKSPAINDDSTTSLNAYNTNLVTWLSLIIAVLTPVNLIVKDIITRNDRVTKYTHISSTDMYKPTEQDFNCLGIKKDDSITLTLDYTGINTPIPIMRFKQWSHNWQDNTKVIVISTDPGTSKDVEAYCKLNRCQIQRSRQDCGKFYFILEKQPSNP